MRNVSIHQLKKEIRTILNEINSLKKEGNYVDFDRFPKSILKTLDDEYSYYEMNFDWNKKTSEFDYDAKKFNEWRKKNKSEQFIKNIDEIIKKIEEDIFVIKNKKLVEKKLESFEELIKPTLGDEVLLPALTKYQEYILLNPNLKPEDIETSFRDSKKIIDKYGNINKSKTEYSQIFKGGEISLPAFEEFARKNPEYKGVFEDWKKLFYEYIDLSSKKLNAFRDSVSIDDIIELRDFLVKNKNKFLKQK